MKELPCPSVMAETGWPIANGEVYDSRFPTGLTPKWKRLFSVSLNVMVVALIRAQVTECLWRTVISLKFTLLVRGVISLLYACVDDLVEDECKCEGALSKGFYDIAMGCTRLELDVPPLGLNANIKGGD